MATATIPELIQPGVLFTPDDTPFSVSPGALPNTDDALAIDGLAAAVRAYQPAISGIHYPAGPSDPISIICWIRGAYASASATGTITALYGADLLFGVMDINYTYGATIATNANTTGFAWAVSHGIFSSTPLSHFTYHRSKGSNSRAYAYGYRLEFRSGEPGPAMLSIRDAGGATTPTMHYNGLNTMSGSGGGAGSAGTPGALVAPNFAIGPFSTLAGWSFPARTGANPVILAKFSIFNRVLTDTELSDLYTSMTVGPPSP